MSISRETFDPTKRYAQVRFHEDRDLLDSELNELQAIIRQRHRAISDTLLTPGMLLSGCVATATGATVILSAGTVYVDGQVVAVPDAVLNYDPAKSSGTDHIWLALLHRVVDVTLDPTLINPLTGEPTAEREQGVVTVHAVDPSTEPLPPNALGRTVLAIYDFDRATGRLTPTVSRPLRPADPARWDAHIGQGGGEQHPPATPFLDGFLSAADKVKLESIAVGATVGQRLATLVVAAANTTDAGKAAADYICDGVHDQVEINEAISALPLCDVSSASLATSFPTPNSQLIFTAAQPGAAGNGISIALVDPGVPQAGLQTTMTGRTITVSLATDATGAICTTAAQLKADLNAQVIDIMLTNVARYHDGTGLVAAMPATPLTGGLTLPAGRVVLLEGQYEIWHPIVLRSYLTLEGQGPSTCLHVPNYCTGIDVLTTERYTDTPCIRARVAHLRIDGNRQRQLENEVHSGLYGYHMQDCIVEHLVVEAMSGYGLMLGGDPPTPVQTRTTFQHNQVIDCTYGISLDLVETCDVCANHLRDCFDGIMLMDSTGCRVEQNVCLRTGHDGMQIIRSSQNLLHGNWCEASGQRTDNTYAGIRLNGSGAHSDDNSVQQNICRHGGLPIQARYGIAIDDPQCRNTWVTNNDLAQSGRSSAFHDAGVNTNVQAGNHE